MRLIDIIKILNYCYGKFNNVLCNDFLVLLCCLCLLYVYVYYDRFFFFV